MPTNPKPHEERPGLVMLQQTSGRGMDQIGLIAGEADVELTVPPIQLPLAEARKLHAWLGRYIAWREAKDGKN